VKNLEGLVDRAYIGKMAAPVAEPDQKIADVEKMLTRNRSGR
jgi:hypothetical protein